MDDQRFDDIIKQKVGEFEPEGFDPSALSALHYQMAATITLPWYVRYRTELVVGTGIVLCTIMILLSQWLISNENTNALEDKMQAILTQQAQINDLQSEILRLKSLTPDTIHITEKDPYTLQYVFLLKRISTLESNLKQYLKNEARVTENEEQLSELTFDPSQGYYSNPKTSDSFKRAFSSRLHPRIDEKESLKAQPLNNKASDHTKKPQLSSKTIRDLEKHYHRGIGIKLGPVLEASKVFPSGGSGKFIPVIGVLSDFIVSPSLSLETGVKYLHRDDTYDREAIATMQLPENDPSLDLQVAEVDSWMLEIPATIKYRYPFTMKTHGLTGIGYSSMIYLRQDFDYSYPFQGEDDVYINKLYENQDVKFYPGTINFSIGLSHEFKNKKILETSLSYQHGIQPLGLEKNQTNFLSLRGVYWFSIK